MREPFDSEAFYAALNAVRLSRQMTWKDVAAAAGVNASTLSRMREGSKPDVDGLASLLKWSGLKAEDFIAGSGKEDAGSLGKITALLRADPKLSKDSAKLIEDIIISTYNRLRR